MNEMETTARNYTLRRLKDKDLWPVLDIIGQVFPGDLSTVFAQIMTGDKNVEQLGAEVVMKLVVSVIRNMNKVQDDVYALLSDVSGMTPEEIQEMEFGTTPLMIWDIVKNEKNASFFGVVSKSF
ncbi:MAG: hypothetical protein J6V25_02150 [Oscillospiraceae bacterium]|nr:hypothetical protein [Oscillospiraceae bacterium]